jgi:hypothetical protein
VRPPALVTEYLGAGSLRGAISRRADFLRSDSVRIKLALDTARVRARGGEDPWLWAVALGTRALVAWAGSGGCSLP